MATKLESDPNPAAVTTSPKSYLGQKIEWREREVIAVTTTPPTSFEALKKYPMPIIRRIKPQK